MDHGRALVYTEPANPTDPPDRIFLDQLGKVAVVSGLTWTTCWPGGDLEATANLTAAPDLVHRALTPGRRATITCGGANRWQGNLDEPARGNPWQLHLTGTAGLASQFGAGQYARYGGGTNPPINVDAIVDDAASRGLPYTRGGATLGPPAGFASSSSGTVAQALADYGIATGTVWSLRPQPAGGPALITMGTIPTTASMILSATDILNPTMAGYFTQVLVTYATGFVGQLGSVLVSDAAAVGKYGRREAPLDITGQGAQNAATATLLGQQWLNANKPQLRYTTQITVQPGQLTIPGGGPVDLMTVRAGCLLRVIDVDPTHNAMLTPGPLKLLVGTTSYSTTTGALTVTPAGAVGQDLKSVLYQGAGGAV